MQAGWISVRSESCNTTRRVTVSIATGYGLGDPGIESRWRRDFPHQSRPALGPPSLLYNGYRVFPRGKERPGRDADPSPLLVPWSRKSRAIPLLPLWAVRPVQSLSACTRVHFTFTYLYNIPVGNCFSYVMSAVAVVQSVYETPGT